MTPTVSLVSYHVVKNAPITSLYTRAIRANGSPLNVVGETVADIVLGGVAVQQMFAVIRNLTIDCLLGADFLQVHDAVLDCNVIKPCHWEMIPDPQLYLIQRTLNII